ncbi:MAG: glycosyltransferase [Acidobacteriota bacterium]|nr:glycosyltransferase [Acidobacteriota bacterium]MDH3783724.1 glycosyltransferase [Acidobacteriota bacterium]
MGCSVGLVIGQLHRGGAEKQLTALAKGLRRNHGMRPIVYCLSDVTEPYGPELRDSGVDVRILPMRGIARLTRPLQLARLLRSDGIDVLQAFLMGPTLHSAVANLVCRLPFVTSFRWGPHPRHRLRRAVDKWAHRQADAVTANSRSGLEFVAETFQIQPSRLTHVPNGVDFSGTSISRERARDQLGLPRNAQIILGVARLVSDKNLPLFVKVVARVLSTHPEAICILAGDGPEYQAVQQLVGRTAFKNRIKLVGLSNDVPQLLAAADCLLLTSHREGTPNAVLEAMVAGLPVVVTAVGDLPRVVCDGETGHVLPPGDEEGLTAACNRLLDDDEEATKLGQAGAQRVRKGFSTDTMVATYAGIYDRLTKVSG